MGIHAFPAGLLIGVVIGVVCTIFAAVNGPASERYTDTQRSLNECQKDLPRSQTCELVAVPLINK